MNLRETRITIKQGNILFSLESSNLGVKEWLLSFFLMCTINRTMKLKFHKSHFI